MTTNTPVLSRRVLQHFEPNHRQNLAVDRIEFAVGELTTVLLANCRSHDAVAVAARDIRKAVAPVVADILSED